MSSFTFQRLQYLQSFTLSNDYNLFIYISKISMFSVIYAFKRLQCLHLHLQDFNIFCLLHLQDFNVFCLLHFTRLQCLLSFKLYETSTSSVFYRAQHPCLWLLRTQCPLHLCFKKKLQKSSTLRNFNVLHFTFYKTSMSSCFFGFASLVFTSCPVE